MIARRSRRRQYTCRFRGKIGAMNRTHLPQMLRRTRGWLTLEGRLSAAQPWVFLLGPAALALALIAPYQGLFVVAYSYLLLVVVMYLWVRQLGPQVRLRRRLLAEWAQVGDQIGRASCRERV